ncbi:MAG: metal ABC transporter permease [Caldimicrobium sp.]
MENVSFYLSLFKWGLLAGTFFAISTAFTSPYLLLQRNSLFPHALTHILLLSLFILSLISSYIPVYFHFFILLLITSILSAAIFLIIRLTHVFEDTATSLITYLALALALVIATKSSQYDVVLLNYLFGSLMLVDKINVFESLIVLIISFLVYLKYKELWLAQSIEKEIPGINFRKSGFGFFFLITLQTIIGVKLMGVLLVSAFFVYSGTLALKLSPSFKRVVPLTAILNLMGIFLGFILSIFFDIPFSASAILFMSIYLIIILLKRS